MDSFDTESCKKHNETRRKPQPSGKHPAEKSYRDFSTLAAAYLRSPDLTCPSLSRVLCLQGQRQPEPRGCRRRACRSPGDIWLNPSARSAAEAAKNNSAVLKEQALLMQIPDRTQKGALRTVTCAKQEGGLEGLELHLSPLCLRGAAAARRGASPAARGGRHAAPLPGTVAVPPLGGVTKPLINNAY